MNLAEILTEDATLSAAHGESKKRTFELISELASRAIDDMDEKQIFEYLNQRERLGSTYIGHGAAIPHARVKESKLSHPVGVLIHLDRAIPYGDNEDELVDLVFALLVPEEATEQHLQVLASLAAMFGDDQYRQKLRNAKSDHALYKLAINHQ